MHRVRSAATPDVGGTADHPDRAWSMWPHKGRACSLTWPQAWPSLSLSPVTPLGHRPLAPELDLTFPISQVCC